MSDEAEKKHPYAELGNNLCKLLLVILPALGIGTYAYQNHQQSAEGYAVLAKALNHEVMDKLEALDKRVVQLEARVALVPASQPAAAPTSAPAIKPPRLATKVPPAAKAPAKAPVSVKATIELKAPMKVPVKAPAKAPPEKSPLKMMKRVPEKMGDAKL